MGCNTCGGNKNKNNPVSNLIQAAKQQPDKIKWFKDGINGLMKCMDQQTSYTDEEIKANRKTCAECPYSTKNSEGKLTATSQCMAIDPETKAPCACFIICKTQSGKCPIGKWTSLTINDRK